MISFKQVFYSSAGWDISQAVETYKPFPEDGTTPKDSYILNGIAAHLNEDSHNSQHNIVISTYGTLIYAVDLVRQAGKSQTSKWVDINKYQKPVGFNGNFMKINDAWVIFKGNRVHPPQDTGVFVYKYGKSEEPHIFTSIDLSNRAGGSVYPPPEGGDDPVDPGMLSNLPVTIFKHTDVDATGATTTKTVVAVGTTDPNYPIKYWGLGPMMVFIPQGTTNADLDKVKINIDAMQPIQVSLK